MPKERRGKVKPDFNKLQISDQSKQEQFKQLKSIASIQIKRTKALDILSGNQIPKKINFRDQQIKQITNYINDCLNKKIKTKYRILMITGSPGAGKSLSVNHILSKLDYQVIRFNANIIKTVRDVQNIISDKILNKSYGAGMSTIQLVRNLEEQTIKKKYILYIEQIQIILQQKTNIFTEDFFMLFSNPKLNIMLLGISNTIDSMAKYSKSIAVNLKDIKNIVFEPYAQANIVQIMKQKLKQIQKKTGFKIIASQKVLNFMAGKLYNLKKGDIRIILQFLKNLASTVLPKKFQECHSANEQGYVVDLATCQQVFGNLKITKNQIIQSLPRNQQLVLIALYLIIKKTDNLFTLKKDLYLEAKKVYENLGIESPKNILDQSIDQIQQYALITKMVKKNGQQRIMLKVSLSQIQLTFQDKPLYKKFFQEFKK